MGRRMPNMVIRNGWYHYRKVVPQGLRMAVGKREFKESLDTRDPAVAKARWTVVSARVEEELALLRRRGRAEEFDTSSLTNWEVHSFAGTFYRELVAKNGSGRRQGMGTASLQQRFGGASGKSDGV